MWRKGEVAAPRHDMVFLEKDLSQAGMRGLHAARVLLLFSFTSADATYPCALVHWFVPVADEPDNVTGMWVVKPEYTPRGERVVSIVHVDSILRAAHLIPVFLNLFIPASFSYTDSLDAFNAYYVNKFTDHHAHEIAF